MAHQCKEGTGYKGAVSGDICAIAGSPQTLLRDLREQVDLSGVGYILCRLAFTYEESRTGWSCSPRT